MLAAVRATTRHRERQNSHSVTSIQARLIGLLFTFCCFSYSAQALTPIKPNNQVLYSSDMVTEDYIWLGNQSGLFRYDGQHAVNILDYTNSSSFTWVRSMHLENNYLYFSTGEGGFWRLEKDKFSLEKLNIKKPFTAQTWAMTKVGQLLYYSDKFGLFQYNLASDSNVKLEFDGTVTDLLKHQDTLIIAAKEGLYRYRDDKIVQLSMHAVIAVSSDQQAVTYIEKHPEHGLQLCQLKSMMCQAIDKQNILQIAPDRYEQGFWLLFKDGQLQYWQVGEKSAKQSYQVKLPSQFIYSMSQDKHGVLWFASNKGLYKYHPLHYRDLAIEYANQIELNYLMLAKHQEQVVVGTNGAGLYQFDTELQQAKPLAFNSSLSNYYQRQITGFASDNNTLFFSTFRGVYATNDMQTLERVDQSNHQALYVQMTQLKDLLFAFNESEGVEVYDINTRMHRHTLSVENNGLPTNEVLSVVQDKADRYWVSTAKGVVILDTLLSQARKLENMPTVSKSSSLHVMGDKVYIGTVGNGLYIFNTQGELLNHLLAGRVIFALTEFRDVLWVSTNMGLYQINMREDSASLVIGTDHWHVTDGIIPVGENLLVPTMQGVMQVPWFSQTPSNPKVTISEVISSSGSSLFSDDIQLVSSEELVTLNLAVLDFRNTINQRYRYRIDDGRWQEFNGSSLSLTGLSGGTHILQIQGTDSLGFWSNNEVFANIQVKPKWYWNDFSRFIYAALILLIAGAISWLIKIKAQAAFNAKQLLQGELLLKQKTYSLVKLSLRKIYQLSEQNDDLSALTKIRELSENALQQIALKNHQGMFDSLGTRSLETALPLLVNHLSDQYKCTIELNMDIDKDIQLNYEVQSDIYRALYELANLSIYEAQSSHVELTLRHYNGKIWLICHDDGESLTLLQKHVGVAVGIQLLKQIGEKYQSRIEFGRRKQNGNAITLAFVLNPSEP
ncbi:hypothetical protein HR060_16245 [Catenovulum sp. SM1970]|uniref:ligand-binding sensor domain-containing protein n=1 Tax=Marinifaba aquimaris TaxID=2741323 RepID=UPI0015739AFE|nr:sensor histidine kinase [Marinifaba aquimaris]NTS78400.1 hypothetical protein [Marinifaba aquimaris]